MNKKYFEWLVKLQTDDQRTFNYQLRSLWAPDKVQEEFVARTGAAEATIATGKKHYPVSATLLGDAAEVAAAV